MTLSNSGVNDVDVHHLSCSHVFRDEAVAAISRNKPSLFNFADGTNVPISWRFKDAYHDEYTREILPHAHITESIVDELAYFNEHVWLGVPLKTAKDDPDGKILNGRFIFSNKGDLSQPDCRARYVACEIATHEDHACVFSDPALEAKRILLSQWASERVRGGRPLKVHFADARKAYFNGKPTRSL